MSLLLLFDSHKGGGGKSQLSRIKKNKDYEQEYWGFSVVDFREQFYRKNYHSIFEQNNINIENIKQQIIEDIETIKIKLRK